MDIDTTLPTAWLTSLEYAILHGRAQMRTQMLATADDYKSIGPSSPVSFISAGCCWAN